MTQTGLINPTLCDHNKWIFKILITEPERVNENKIRSNATSATNCNIDPLIPHQPTVDKWPNHSSLTCTWTHALHSAAMQTFHPLETWVIEDEDGWISPSDRCWGDRPQMKINKTSHMQTRSKSTPSARINKTSPQNDLCLTQWGSTPQINWMKIKIIAKGVINSRITSHHSADQKSEHPLKPPTRIMAMKNHHGARGGWDKSQMKSLIRSWAKMAPRTGQCHWLNWDDQPQCCDHNNSNHINWTRSGTTNKIEKEDQSHPVPRTVTLIHLSLTYQPKISDHIL